MPTDHPRYPNPTIREALCEVHFQLSEESPWKPAFFGDFYKAIQNDFPEMEPISEVGWQLEAGPTRVEHRVLPQQFRMRYKHASRNLLLQLSEGILTVNVLPVYPGWDSMRESIADAWNRAAEVLHPVRVNRVGLRYIDFIDRENADERPAEWLSASDYLPAAVLSSLPGFLCRSEMRVDAEHRLIVALGEVLGTPGTIVLDIDCIAEKEIAPEADAITSETDVLHSIESDVFFRSMTERLERRLQGT